MWLAEILSTWLLSALLVAVGWGRFKRALRGRG